MALVAGQKKLRLPLTARMSLIWRSNHKSKDKAKANTDSIYKLAWNSGDLSYLCQAGNSCKIRYRSSLFFRRCTKLHFFYHKCFIFKKVFAWFVLKFRIKNTVELHEVMSGLTLKLKGQKAILLRETANFYFYFYYISGPAIKRGRGRATKKKLFLNFLKFLFPI